MNEIPRILAIDPGARRVGLAISDELGITAQGLETFDKKTGDLMDHLAGLFSDYRIDRVVVGYPVSLSGHANETSRLSKSLALEIQKRFGLVVKLWDERFSSKEARRTVAGNTRDKKRVDKIAAVLILQGFMETGGKGGFDPDSVD